VELSDPEDLAIVQRALEDFRRHEQGFANGSLGVDRPPELRARAEADYLRALAILRRVKEALR
jgi:hypothetical protein